ncbi:MAG: hypothetical protein L0177_03065 [Chloroflexi bacterium]|nr:hypothetical protein [Chloroflexota bacterium]
MGVEEIKTAIVQLSPDELAELAAWFEEFHANAWNRQIEEDLESGRLDKLIKQAEEAFDAGRNECWIGSGADYERLLSFNWERH